MPARTQFRAFALAAWMLVNPTTGFAEAPMADPPGRVGRLAQITGMVAFRATDQADWQPAALNFPITSGQSYRTDADAGAAIDIAASRLVLDQGSELDLASLDDHRLAAEVPQGSLALALRRMDAGEMVTLRIPRGTVTLAQDGHYIIEAGDAGQPDTVTVIDGRAQVFGPGISLAVGPHQTATIGGQGNPHGSVGPQANDAFIAANTPTAQSAPIDTSVIPEQVQEMTGGTVLAETGAWDVVPEYGHVWYPPVDVGWVPYRHGHWAYVLPWGWTWVDDAPWGFAPFHYGRWLQIGPRWGWIPDRWEAHHRPVYAPALVAFVGYGAGVAIGARFGSPVGWIPLGPREPYRPAYGASPAYRDHLNFGHDRAVINDRYVNRHVTTVVPAAAMANALPVARNTRLVAPQALGAGRPTSQPPVLPTHMPAGIAGNVGRQFGAQPGPAISPRPASSAPIPAARPMTTGAPRPIAPLAHSPTVTSPKIQRPFVQQQSSQPAYRPAAQPALPHIQSSPPQYQRPMQTYQPARPHYSAPPQQQHFATPQQRGTPTRACQPGHKSC